MFGAPQSDWSLLSCRAVFFLMPPAPIPDRPFS